jgi:hypothetical protein
MLHGCRHHLAKREALAKFVKEYGVQSAPKRIVPTIIGEWNAKKGGVDNLSRSLSRLKGAHEKNLKPTQRLVLDQIKIGLLQAFHSYRGAQIAHDVLTGKMSSMRQIRIRLNAVCTLEEFLSDAIPALDMWMTEGGDVEEARRRDSAEKDKGLSEQEQSSAHSPSVPADTITYNHKYKWTVIPKLRSCRLSKKGTLKV